MNEDPTASPDNRPSDSCKQSSPCMVLIVDDDAAITELIALILKASGMQTETVTDGESALCRVREGGIDVVVSDIQMHGMSGFELLTQIQCFDDTIRVVIMTGFDSYETLKQALQAGAYDYLAKPLEDHELIIASVERAFESTKLQRENAELIARLQTSHEQISAANKRLLLMNRQLRHLAITDALTQLYNRRYIDDWLSKQLKDATEEFECSLILLDVDWFKKVNDTYGHETGDEVLRHLATLLSSFAREYDQIGRYGGEEFILILPDTSQAESVYVAERLRKLVEDTIVRIPEGEVHLTISLGIASLPGIGSQATLANPSSKRPTPLDRQLVSAADKALNRAKELGRNQCVHYASSSEQYARCA